MQLEIRITERPHLRTVETFHLSILADRESV